MGQKLSDLMPNEALDISELSNIKGGITINDNCDEAIRVCDTGACSSGIESLADKCTNAICRTGA